MKKNIFQLMQQITQGVYVIAVTDGELQNAFTASWVMQVSFDPLLLAFSINRQHYSYQMLKKGGLCSINVLNKEQLEIAKHFSRPYSKEKMKAYEWEIGKSSAPILVNSIAYFECEVSHYTKGGDHEIVICRIIEAGFLQEGIPLLYADTAKLDGGDVNYK